MTTTKPVTIEDLETKWNLIENLNEAREQANNIFKHVLDNKLFAIDSDGMGFETSNEFVKSLAPDNTETGSPNYLNLYVRARGRDGNYIPDDNETHGQTVTKFWELWNKSEQEHPNKQRLSDEFTEMAYRANKTQEDYHRLTQEEIAEATGYSRQSVCNRIKKYERELPE